MTDPVLETEYRHAKSRRMRDSFWGLVTVYCVVLLVLQVLQAITSERHWILRSFSYVSDFALIVALIPLPLAIWRRKGLVVVLQLFCAITLLWSPAKSDEVTRVPPPGSRGVTVMTYNLGDGLAAPAYVIPLIEQSGADIVGLQEVTAVTGNALDTQLADTYPYRVIRGIGIPGKALLSKYPIVDYRWLDENPDRPDLLATIDIEGQLVTVIVAHPPPPHLTTGGIVSRPGGDDQFESLLATIDATQGPLLLLGDLNITNDHFRYGQLKNLGLLDAFDEAGDGLGYTTPVRLPILADVSETIGEAPIFPLLRIDYVWGTPHWFALDAWVGDDAGSDHLPVIARMALAPDHAAPFPPPGIDRKVSPAG